MEILEFCVELPVKLEGVSGLEVAFDRSIGGYSKACGQGSTVSVCMMLLLRVKH